jgi:sialate O-acetylesterase
MSIHPKDSEKGISLAGNWKFLPVAEYRGDKFYVMGPDKEQFFTRPRLAIDLSAYLPTTLYNGMIAPVVPYGIRGAIWYQGESNAGNPELYRQLFPLMIRNWRSSFQHGDFPFYYVQIAPFAYDKPTQSEYLREAQLLTMSLNNTGMAVTMDIGNFKNIHPANKQDVGKRLALWALAKTYGQQVSYSGPIYRSMERAKKSIVLTFDNAGKGLVLKNKEFGSGFQIAGEDSVFKDAVAKVQGSRLVVSHPDIKNPCAVRYAFSNTPVATLFNKEGLPASSFRTDVWAR